MDGQLPPLGEHGKPRGPKVGPGAVVLTVPPCPAGKN